MPKIDFPHLAAFVVGCDSPLMSHAAEKLHLKPSALSSKLSTLETQIGLTLFGRKGRNAFPLRSAAWLYNRSIRLLLAEEYTRFFSRSGGNHPPSSIVLEIDVDYTWTSISYAIIAAIRSFHAKPGKPYVDLIFTGNSALGLQKTVPPLLPASASIGQIAIHHLAHKAHSEKSIIIAPDQWVSVSNGPKKSPPQQTVFSDVMVPDLPSTLRNDIQAHQPGDFIAPRIFTTDRSLQDLGGLIDDIQKADLLVPGWMVPRRLRSSKTGIQPFPGMPSCNVVADISANHRLLLDLIEEIRSHLNGVKPYDDATNFQPQISLKQISTVNLVLQTGSMANAARAAGRTAPMVPTQVEQIEDVLGMPLIARKKSGSSPTEHVTRLHPMFLGIERSFNDALGERSHIAAVFEQSIRVALPVSWSADSLTSECMAVALSRFHAEFPHCRIEVVEGPRDVLHRGILTGRFNIAIVGRVDPQVGSLPIGRSEDISLIVNRKANFSPKTERVTAEELRSVPLILAPSQLTMHQTLLTALAKSTVQLEPVMRLGSVPLIVSVLRRSPLGTILPASVMLKEIEAGIVDAFPLDHLVPPRRLWAIFSTASPLNKVERNLIGQIKEAFQRATGIAIHVPDHSP